MQLFYLDLALHASFEREGMGSDVEKSSTVIEILFCHVDIPHEQIFWNYLLSIGASSSRYINIDS